MKSNAILCEEYPVRVLFNDDKTLAWVNLHDLCKVLGREEMLTDKAAIRQLPSSIQGAKPPRRYGLLGEISLLSPG